MTVPRREEVNTVLDLVSQITELKAPSPKRNVDTR